LEVPLKVLIEKSPFTLPNLPSNIFLGDKSTKIYIIDVEKGEIKQELKNYEQISINNMEGQNLITIIRIDYTLKNLLRDRGTEFWNLTVSEITAIESSSSSENTKLTYLEEELREYLEPEDNQNKLAKFDFFKKFIEKQNHRTHLPKHLNNYKNKDFTQSFKNYLEKVKNNEIRNEYVKIFEEILEWSKIHMKGDNSNNKTNYLFAIIIVTINVFFLLLLLHFQQRIVKIEKENLQLRKNSDNIELQKDVKQRQLANADTTITPNSNVESKTDGDKVQDFVTADNPKEKLATPLQCLSDLANIDLSFKFDINNKDRERLMSVEDKNCLMLDLSQSINSNQHSRISRISNKKELYSYKSQFISHKSIKFQNNVSIDDILINYGTNKSPKVKNKNANANTDHSIKNISTISPSHLRNNGSFENGRLLKNFKDFRMIGAGGFGSVFVAKHHIDSYNYAIKVIQLRYEENEDLSVNPVVKEVQTMTRLNHKNVVRYYTSWFEMENCLKIVNEDADESKLSSVLPDKSKLKEDSELQIDGDNNLTNSVVEFEKNTINQDETINNNESNVEKDSQIVFLENSTIEKNESINKTNKNAKNSVKAKPNLQVNAFDKHESYQDLEDNNSNIIFLKNNTNTKKKNNHKKGGHNKLISVKKKIKAYFYMQMDFCEGMSLKEFLESRTKPLETKMIFNFFKQILLGVDHIHENKIIHRDLK